MDSIVLAQLRDRRRDLIDHVPQLLGATLVLVLVWVAVQVLRFVIARLGPRLSLRSALILGRIGAYEPT